MPSQKCIGCFPPLHGGVHECHAVLRKIGVATPVPKATQENLRGNAPLLQFNLYLLHDTLNLAAFFSGTTSLSSRRGVGVLLHTATDPLRPWITKCVHTRVACVSQWPLRHWKGCPRKPAKASAIEAQLTWTSFLPPKTKAQGFECVFVDLSGWLFCRKKTARTVETRCISNC